MAFDNGDIAVGTTGIRAGRQDSLYFEIKGFDEVPFASGRGLLRAGISLPCTPYRSRIWLGSNVGPYMNWGPTAGYEFPLEASKTMFLNGRIGWHHQKPEYGFSLGLRLKD